MITRDWFYRQEMLMRGKGLTPSEKADHLYGNFVQVAGAALEKRIAEWVGGQSEINMESAVAQKSLARWIMKKEMR